MTTIFETREVEIETSSSFNDSQNRIYGKPFDLDETNIRKFFDKRAHDYTNSKRTRNTTVLLGDSNAAYADYWDKFEKEKVLPLLNITLKDTVLDIGCGVGRWAESVLPLCCKYVGTDLSSKMIDVARETFRDYRHAYFVDTSFQGIFDNEVIKKTLYDVVIIAGCSMYLNDKALRECYAKLKGLLAPGARIYIEESVGIQERLTLNQIWSEGLRDHYCAVYRTSKEYLELLQPLVADSDVIQSGTFDELNKEELSETGHWYIILRRKILK